MKAARLAIQLRLELRGAGDELIEVEKRRKGRREGRQNMPTTEGLGTPEHMPTVGMAGKTSPHANGDLVGCNGAARCDLSCAP